MFIFQLEVVIDNSKEASKGDFLRDFTIEAAVYDTGSLPISDGEVDLLSADACHLKFCPPRAGTLGFHGYMLAGKLKLPKLWTAEHVRFSPFYKLLIIMSLQLAYYWHVKTNFELKFSFIFNCFCVNILN